MIKVMNHIKARPVPLESDDKYLVNTKLFGFNISVAFTPDIQKTPVLHTRADLTDVDFTATRFYGISTWDFDHVPVKKR